VSIGFGSFTGAAKAVNVAGPGVDALQHIVVLMMENRSFDHMLGGLQLPGIDGLTGDETNPDTNGAEVKVAPDAEYQGQLDPDPDHHFPGVHLQIFDGGPQPTMKGFIKSYFTKRRSVEHSRQVMLYFDPKKLPVLTTLATQFTLFNAWFSSIPGPTLCNRAFAHYGTSFGHVGMELRYANQKYPSIYERLLANGCTGKVYFFDDASSPLEVVNLLQHQAEFFGTFRQFLEDCADGTLPDYSFIEPNYSDHEEPGGRRLLANDQHPDHHVLEGERFIGKVYNAIRANPSLWRSTALLVVYDEHGGCYDHVPPPMLATPDEFAASAADTGTGGPFTFDRLGVRVPAILVSPWTPKGAIVNDVFEHASIPATVMQFALGPKLANAAAQSAVRDAFDQRSPREKAAATFLDLLSLSAPRSDTPSFKGL
jgi:phospholipase C